MQNVTHPQTRIIDYSFKLILTAVYKQGNSCSLWRIASQSSIIELVSNQYARYCERYSNISCSQGAYSLAEESENTDINT